MNPRKDHTLIPFGQHQGTPWKKVDESWLYFIARKASFIGKLARKEIRERCQNRGTHPPIWTDEEEEVQALRGRQFTGIIIHDEAIHTQEEIPPATEV